MKRAMTRSLSIAAAAASVVAALAVAPVPATAVSGSAGEAVVLVNGAGKTVTGAEVQAAQAVAATVRAADAPRNKARGGASTSSIIGSDDRVQVVSSVTNLPYRMVVHIESGPFGCTGFMVSRDTVLTAAHCLYDYWNGAGWTANPSYTIRPGRSGSREPYGSCSGGAGDTWVPNDWVNTGQQRYDVGAIKLTCNIGDQTGWFSIFANDSYSQVGSSIQTVGYPGDKPYGTMWRANGTVNAQDAYSMNISNDTANGQSGSPLYRYGAPSGCSGYCAAGIWTNHASDPSVGNLGVRFNSSVTGHINYWISLP